MAHQMVLNPSSTSTPIRTVFNSSQVYKGFSLNSSWDLGPDMTGNLQGILMRFRENIKGAQGDIKKMYYNVRVTKKEEFMQLYIWKFKGEEKIRTFAMTRLAMGNKPSANCSQIALKETTRLNKINLQYPEAAKDITDNSYVDNSFTTGESVEAIKQRVGEIENIAELGGFSYEPWVISGEDVPCQVIMIPDKSGGPQLEQDKALGMYWNVREDKFFVKI